MVCQSCGTREATILVQTVVGNHFTKAALCSTCAGSIAPAAELDAMMEALVALRTRAHPARCPVCRISFATFRASGRFGCPNCYEHFLAQVKDLLPRVHAGAYQHRGKTPGRR
jgi:protein arginine kinase activator